MWSSPIGIFILGNITVNQSVYELPERPLVVICADGCAEEYLALGFAHGELPHLAKLAAKVNCVPDVALKQLQNALVASQFLLPL